MVINSFMNSIPRLPVVFLIGIMAVYLPMESCYGLYILLTALTYIAALYFAISTFYPEVSPRKKFLSTLY